MDAKYPALLFKQQLTAYVEKIFGIIRDNLKKELTSLLSLCIQVSRILLAAFSSFLLKLTHVCNLPCPFSGTKDIERSVTIWEIVRERYSRKLLAEHHRKPQLASLHIERKFCMDISLELFNFIILSVLDIFLNGFIMVEISGSANTHPEYLCSKLFVYQCSTLQ